MIDFYQRVEEIRQNKELNKKDFARGIGLTGSNYATLLKGKTTNGELAKTLYELFNINLNWLISGSGSMYNATQKTKVCSVNTLVQSTVKMLIESNAVENAPKNTGYIGAITDESLEDFERSIIYTLKELNKPYKIIDAKGLTDIQLIGKFKEFGNTGEKWEQIQKSFYFDNTVWIIKNISKLKSTKEHIYQTMRAYYKTLDDAHFKGVEPLGNLIFLDKASFLENNHEIAHYFTTNLKSKY